MSRKVLVLSHADVERLLPMGECVEAMAEALAGLARGTIHQPLRFVVRAPEAPGLLGLMPAYRAEPSRVWALKTVCVYPQNQALGLDPHQGAVLLHDGDTGELRAILHAGAVTAIRTAAVSAVATRALARPGSREVAILGSGHQGRGHVAAMRAVLDGCRVRIWSRRPERAEALAAELGADIAASPEEAVRGADVVCTTTASPEPILRRAWLAPGTHVNAVGSSIPTARELDSETLAGASLFVDRRESTLAESGDYRMAAAEGAIGPDHIRAELGEVLVGAHPGRGSDGELTVFKSLGLAAEDLAAAEHVYRRALAEGAGQEVDL
jgi:ornithine cyclodeaminase